MLRNPNDHLAGELARLHLMVRDRRRAGRDHVVYGWLKVRNGCRDV